MVIRGVVFPVTCGVILLVFISGCAAIKCYQCSDSGNDAKSDCLRGVRGLAKERGDYEKNNKTNSLKKYPYLKECEHYRRPTTGQQLYEFCKIEIITSQGSVNAFIRDCSDGTDFSADLNLTRLSFQRKYLRPDNQSTCGYSHRHLANICVQLCDTDFCNGPTAGQTLVHANHLFIFILTALIVHSLKLL
ncbi:uncharacterized protein LOC132745082 [Ruditapes philippinarum]|uniref:uncharacterized protein LOC132745082 n=1 Tax=Ruditapes philippinarum TaxID=129788 RepID=UPI00295C28AA|nr:uncharacterized protein LOC132745082 [Ruditapes philippinarum]